MTARWRTREELEHQVAILTTQGMSRHAIARALGVSRSTSSPTSTRGSPTAPIHSA
jgi:transposase